MLKSIVAVGALLAASAFAAFQADGPCQSCPAGAGSPVSTAKTGACCAQGGCSQAGKETLVAAEKSSGCCSDCAACQRATVSTKVDGKKTCPAGACGTDCKDCPVTVAMKRLPRMTYKVGTETTPCPKTAAKMAEKADAKIQFVVGTKTYASKTAALTALAETTEHFVAEFTKPHVCDKSGAVTLAGKTMKCQVSAGKLARTAREAMDKVRMTYLVGKTACQCPKEAAKLAKESGQEKVFVVGQEKTCCSVTARLNLARAKYKAAVIALRQAESKQASNTAPAKKTLAGT